MELRHLRYFLTVAEELSFSRAAERLFISQPPLSRQIKELEDELGARLFERNNKRVVLTEAGEYFQKQAQQLMHQLEKAALTTRKIAENVSGTFRIGYISSTFSGHISDLVRHLTQKFPYVNIKLYEVPTARQIEDLEQGRLDLGILRGPVLSTRIETQNWYNDNFALVFNTQQYQLTQEDELANLDDARFIFFNKDYAPNFYDALIQLCAQHGFEPNVVHQANNIGSIIQLVKSGLGISIVPNSNRLNYTDPELGFIELKKRELFTRVLLATPKAEIGVVCSEAISFLKRLVVNQ